MKGNQKESLKNSMKSYELKDMSLLKLMGGFKAAGCPKGSAVINYADTVYVSAMV